MEETWNSERLGRPAVWIAGRALVLTLIVLLAISFDRGTVIEGASESELLDKLPCGKARG